MKDEDIFENYGIDAAVLLILTRFCVKSCTFACILALACLLPIYLTARNNNLEGFRSVTLAACLRDPESNSMRLWIAVVAAYVMTAHALFYLGALYEQFVQLRHRYFVKRAFDCERSMDMTPGLTLMVENIPPDLKNSEERLKTYFDRLFPRNIFAVQIMREELHGMDSIAESYETIQQFEKETMQGTAQCTWVCGQPYRCLCCLCGQPGVCTCLTRCLPSLYSESLPSLESAKENLFFLVLIGKFKELLF